MSLGLVFAYCGYEIIGFEAGLCEDRVLDARRIETTRFDLFYLRRDGESIAWKVPAKPH